MQMTHPPDIINQNINKYAGAMDALAKGDEMNLTAYQDDGDFGKKFIAEQRKWIAEFEANPDDAQHNCDASDFSGLLGEALTEIERLNSQLAERDALIERLVAAGQTIADGAKIYDDKLKNCQVAAWELALAEWQAMKGGEG